MTEEWKPIPGFEGRYEASTLGRVRSLRAPNGRQRSKPRTCSTWSDDRSTRCTLTVRYKSRSFLLHRLILRTFVGPCPPGMEGSHKDGDFTNCRLDNLCWETHTENEQRKSEHGTRQRGSQIVHAKLTDETVLKLRERYRNGEQISPLAAEAGVNRSTLSVALRGLTWKHVPMK